MPRDRALALYIEPPRPYYRRKLLVVAPLLVWVAAALATLVAYAPDEHPALSLMFGLICSGVGLIAMATPLVWRSIREILGALAARKLNKRAVALLNRSDDADAAAEAETMLREALAQPRLVPSSMAGLVHNLGVARFARGDAKGGRDLLEHAWKSGWMMSLALRRHRAIHAQAMVVVCVANDALDDARAALVRSRAAQTPAQRPVVDVAALLLHTRAEEYAEALQIAEGLDYAALAPQMAATARLVRAMAAHQTGAAADQVALFVSEIPTLAPNRLAWAAEGWPELMAFATEHNKAP
jgi:hypothetical protein